MYIFRVLKDSKYQYIRTIGTNYRKLAGGSLSYTIYMGKRIAGISFTTWIFKIAWLLGTNHTKTSISNQEIFLDQENIISYPRFLYITAITFIRVQDVLNASATIKIYKIYKQK